MELHATDIIKRKIVTEKSSHLGGSRNMYSFVVDRRAEKGDIRKAVEELFKVKVVAVRTLRMPGKPRRTRTGYVTTPEFKKAVVELRAEDRIEVS